MIETDTGTRYGREKKNQSRILYEQQPQSAFAQVMKTQTY